jgi:hypothetical protein
VKKLQTLTDVSSPLAPFLASPQFLVTNIPLPSHRCA